MSSRAPAKRSEFHPYRRFLGIVVLVFSVVSIGYALTSIIVELYRRRHPTPIETSEIVGEAATMEQARRCFDEVRDVQSALSLHLESFHHLLAEYDAAEAQKWGDEGAVWKRQWAAVGKRCRFAGGQSGPFRREMDELSEVWRTLGALHDDFTRTLSRFGENQISRLRQARLGLERIGSRLNRLQGQTAP